MDSSDAFAAFGEPPAPPWDPNTGPIDDSNPYGFWDGRAGNLTSPMCRKTEPLYLCSLCGDNTPEDPSGFLRAVVIFDHLLMFVGPIWVVWEVFQKKDVLNKRVYSPFLLLFGASIMQAGSMAEIASHIFTMNWNACYDTADTPMKLFFYTFISFGFTGWTIAFRKKGFPLLRRPSGVCDWAIFIIDMVMIVVAISIPLVYVMFGKESAMTFFIVAQSLPCLMGIPRIYTNLLGQKFQNVCGSYASIKLLLLVAITQIINLVGVALNTPLQNTGNQWLHVAVGACFATGPFGVALCIRLSDYQKPKQIGNNVPWEGTPML